MTAATVTAASPSGPVPYDDAVIRRFVVATVFWGVVAFAAGVFIALQLAYPVLNLDLEWTTFGRLRPRLLRETFFSRRRYRAHRAAPGSIPSVSHTTVNENGERPRLLLIQRSASSRRRRSWFRKL